MRPSTISRPGLILALLLPVVVSAHPPGLSSIDLTEQQGGGFELLLTLSRFDAEIIEPMDADRDGKISERELDDARADLEALPERIIELKIDGVRAFGRCEKIWADDKDNVLLRVSYPGSSGKHITLRSNIFDRLPGGHRQITSLYASGQDEAVSTDTLTQGHPVFDSEIPGSRLAFLILGIEHILTGYDHLLFLFALLVIGIGFRDAALIITSFTVAHSITLALATYDIVRLPGEIVEPIIALSIVYVGIENILKKETRYRWALTFVFGLIHGLGFASVLRDLGIGDRAGDGWIVLLFNLGVELGQLAIACLVLPFIWKVLQPLKSFRRISTALSVLVALLGLYWFIERTLL
jgi:hydrogenase/urease accessory protein HupE